MIDGLTEVYYIIGDLWSTLTNNFFDSTKSQ